MAIIFFSHIYKLPSGADLCQASDKFHDLKLDRTAAQVQLCLYCVQSLA